MTALTVPVIGPLLVVYHQTDYREGQTSQLCWWGGGGLEHVSPAAHANEVIVLEPGSFRSEILMLVFVNKNLFSRRGHEELPNTYENNAPKPRSPVSRIAEAALSSYAEVVLSG